MQAWGFSRELINERKDDLRDQQKAVLRQVLECSRAEPDKVRALMATGALQAKLKAYAYHDKKGRSCLGILLSRSEYVVRLQHAGVSHDTIAWNINFDWFLGTRDKALLDQRVLLLKG